MPYLIGNATNLDFSGNPDLETIDLFFSTIGSVNLTQNLALTSLDVSFNWLTSLDVSQNIALSSLLCIDNNLTSLDVSNNPNLTVLDCSENNLSCLNVKNGNNINMLYVITHHNYNLTCIEVDDTAFSSNNWMLIDSQTSFSTNCNNSCSSGTVGVSDLISKQLSVSVYPNPVTDEKIVIDFANIESEVDVSLKNSIGQNIYRKTFDNTNVAILPIELPKGIYFLTIQTNSGIIQTEKIIKN